MPLPMPLRKHCSNKWPKPGWQVPAARRTGENKIRASPASSREVEPRHRCAGRMQWEGGKKKEGALASDATSSSVSAYRAREDETCD